MQVKKKETEVFFFNSFVTISDVGCCESLLDCVECCLTNDHQTMIRYQIYALSTKGFPGIDVTDFEKFEFCQALCRFEEQRKKKQDLFIFIFVRRTSSKSIDKHGKFLDEKWRFCYVISDSRAAV
jgi:hypothetical protein